MSFSPTSSGNCNPRGEHDNLPYQLHVFTYDHFGPPFSSAKADSRRVRLTGVSVEAAKYGIQKTLKLSRTIVSFQVFARCFSFFTLRNNNIRVEEMQHADWLICSVWIQDGGITTN